MIRAGAALVRDPDPTRAAAQAAEAALRAARIARPAVVLAFAAGPADAARCADAVVEGAGASAVLVAVGHAVAAGEDEADASGSVAALALGGVDAEAFAISGGEESVSVEVEALLGRSPRDTDLVLLFADPLGLDAARLLESLAELAPATVAGAGVALEGGSSPLLALGARSVPRGGACGVVLSLPTPARVAVSQGCRPFGDPHVVTRADGHWVLELDGKPALDVFAEAARAPLAEDLRRATERVLAVIPLAARTRADAGDAWIARRVSGFAGERRAFALPDAPRVGSRLRFALRDADLARDDLRAALACVAPADAALYLGASDRGRALFGHAGLESALVAQGLAPAPVAGLFGSFEIAPLAGQIARLGHAGVVVALGGGDR